MGPPLQQYFGEFRAELYVQIGNNSAEFRSAVYPVS
jgi:hypothetical protein